MPRAPAHSYNKSRATEPYPTPAHPKPATAATPAMHAASLANSTGPRPVVPAEPANLTHSPVASTMSPGGGHGAASGAAGTGATERPSAAWTAEDDGRLMQLRAKGMNWAPIANHFAGKTPNACRKRHERLMERRNAESWDGPRVEDLARAYLDSREEMWKLVAGRVGEKWQTVEAKCMEKGLKTLQNMGRPRRSGGPRAESPFSHQSGEPDDAGFAFPDPQTAHFDHASLAAAGMGAPLHHHPHPSSYPQPFPQAPQYASRSRGGSAAPQQPQGPPPPWPRPNTPQHRYSLSNASSSYAPAAALSQAPPAASAYASMGYSPTAAGGYPGLPAPGAPLSAYGRGGAQPYDASGMQTSGQSLPSLQSFLQSPREPIAASSY